MTQPNVLEYWDHQERRHTPRPLSLHCLIDRYYDPATGQFLSVDPKVAQTQQAYLYAGDDPVDASDPTGLLAGAPDAQLCEQRGDCGTSRNILSLVAKDIGTAVVSGVIFATLIPHDVNGGVNWAASTILGTFFGPYFPGPTDARLNFNDPSISPGKSWIWKGTGPPGTSRGSWFSPSTGESLHPDFNNPKHHIHYDFNYRGSGSNGWRIYADGKIEKK
jgi:RHS repeat-associated protein